MFVITDLWFHHQDEPILEGLTLDFSRHAVTGLVGANNCGKSALFMDLSGLLRLRQEVVLRQGEALNHSKRDLLTLHQQVATVSQDPDQQIFYTDIDNSIVFSLRGLGVAEEEIAHRVDGTLTLADVQGFRQQPIQYLSHRQKKRVTIAGALVLQARYLLLGEPTASLDSRRWTRMIVIIRRIVGRGRRVMISSHDIDLICEVSDTVYVLRHGEVPAAGDPGEVFICVAIVGWAGLAQSWLMRLHNELGLPLCKTEAEFFQRTHNNVIDTTKGAS